MHSLSKAIFIVAILFAPVTVLHASDYSVNIVGNMHSSDLIKVKNDWRTDLKKRLRVKIRFPKDTDPRATLFKAYFFDADGKLIHSQNAPNSTWESTRRGFEEIDLAKAMKDNRSADVFLALHEANEDFKSIVVVFGVGDDLEADYYPNNAKTKELDFDEKSIVEG